MSPEACQFSPAVEPDITRAISFLYDLVCMDPLGAQYGECAGSKGAQWSVLASHFMNGHRLGWKVPCCPEIALNSIHNEITYKQKRFFMRSKIDDIVSEFVKGKAEAIEGKLIWDSLGKVSLLQIFLSALLPAVHFSLSSCPSGRGSPVHLPLPPDLTHRRVQPLVVDYHSLKQAGLIPLPEIHLFIFYPDKILIILHWNMKWVLWLSLHCTRCYFPFFSDHLPMNCASFHILSQP